MTDMICQHPPYAAAPSARDVIVDALTRWTGWVKRAVVVARQRRALKRLDSRLLADIGVTRDQAAQEAARPFWDMPQP